MTTPPSYYPQYPGYPPQQPSAQAPPAGQPTSVETPPTQPPAAAQPTYVDLPESTSWAHWSALEASNIAAGKPPSQFAVKGPDAPEEFPKTLYNEKKHLTKAATDKKDEEKLQGEGYSETPFTPPALDIPPAMIQHLETVFAAAAVALKELKQLVQQQQQQQQGQQQGQPQSGQQQPGQQQPGQQPPWQPAGTGTGY